MVEKVLAYDHSIVPQETFFDCGPASVQVICNARGVILSERELINEIGTTEDGTAHVGLVVPVLDRHIGGEYAPVWIGDDTATGREVQVLWDNVVGSIDAGYGVVANIMVPTSNYPRGTRGSASPAYRGGFVYHYLSFLGYADDGPGGRHFWCADSGFTPYGYWCSLEQMASCIAGKGYAAATVRARAPEDDPLWSDVLTQLLGRR